MRHRLGSSSSSVAPAREEAEPIQVTGGLAETPSWHGSHRIHWRRSRFASCHSALTGALTAGSGGGREEVLTSIDLIHQAPQLDDGIPRAA
jgi:hypothetical protein